MTKKAIARNIFAKEKKNTETRNKMSFNGNNDKQTLQSMKKGSDNLFRSSEPENQPWRSKALASFQ